MMHRRLYLLSLMTLLVVGTSGLAQDTTGQPSYTQGQSRYWSPLLVDGISLAVIHDARSAGMGEVGLTTSPDAFSIAHNMSKLSFTDRTWGISVAHVPWMTELVKDMNISSLVGYYSFEGHGGLRHSFSGSLKYFHIGSTQAIPKNGNPVTTIHPYEFAVDLGYSLRFYDNWSVGAAVRYLISDYNYAVNGVSSKAQTVMGDLSLSYVKPVNIAGAQSVVTAAVAVNNVGDKMTHDGGATYLFSPAVFRLGVGVSSDISMFHRLGIHVEMDKLLVPTYPSPDSPNYDKEVAAYYAQNAFRALFSSWNDAQGGASEEFKEVNFSIGAEYTYAERLTGRLGYRYQHPSKGMGQGVTFGVGLRYEMVQLDVSYFLATVARSPLNNTLRMTVGIDF